MTVESKPICKRSGVSRTGVASFACGLAALVVCAAFGPAVNAVAVPAAAGAAESVVADPQIRKGIERDPTGGVVTVPATVMVAGIAGVMGGIGAIAFVMFWTAVLTGALLLTGFALGLVGVIQRRAGRRWGWIGLGTVGGALVLAVPVALLSAMLASL